MALMMFRQSEAPRQCGGAEPDPDYVATLARQAAGYAAQGRFPQALRAYQQALLVDDGRADVWFDYAKLQWQMGLKIDAMEGLEFALRLEPDLHAARYCLAKLLYELERPLAAMSQFQHLILQNPDHVSAWRRLGLIYRALGNPAGAEECLREALNRAPYDRDLVAQLDEVLREKAAAAQN